MLTKQSIINHFRTFMPIVLRFANKKSKRRFWGQFSKNADAMRLWQVEHPGKREMKRVLRHVDRTFHNTA